MHRRHVRFIRFVISHRHLESPAAHAKAAAPASRGCHCRSTRGVSWFKDTAVDHLARMHEIRRVLERYGHQVQMLTEARRGVVVYEDEYQVVAEPGPPG